MISLFLATNLRGYFILMRTMNELHNKRLQNKCKKIRKIFTHRWRKIVQVDKCTAHFIIHTLYADEFEFGRANKIDAFNFMR